MMSADDVKANIKQQEIKDLVALSYKFFYLSSLKKKKEKLEIQCKNRVYFSFDPGWYTIHLDTVH